MEKIYVAGHFVNTKNEYPIYNPFTNQIIRSCGLADVDYLETAIVQSQLAFSKTKSLSSLERYTILSFISNEIDQNKQNLAELLSRESAKPMWYAITEIERSVETFRIAAEESKRLPKEYMSLDWTVSGKNKEAWVAYFPIGIIAGITPFNFPMNLVAHKVAPAIAAGCPIILKPSSNTPLTALELAKIIDRSDWPKGAFSVLPCHRETGNQLVKDDRIALVSFTGSPEVGWEMKKQCGKKKIVLELGGNAGVLIDQTANLDRAIERCLMGAFAYSGQICIHAQRIFVVEEKAEEFKNRFVEATKQLKNTDPLDSNCRFSVMIDEKNAKRVEAWVEEALKSGAKLICGGKREGAFYEATILSQTNSNMKVYAEEVFGPVVCIETVKTFEEGIQKLNDTRYGLQAGIFTDSHQHIQYAFQQLDVGGVIINDVPTYRADHMPYGGIKDSGLGREGVKYAIQDYLEAKVLVV